FLGYRVSVSGRSKPKPSANSSTRAVATICEAFWKTDYPSHPSLLSPSRSRLGQPPLVDNPYCRATRALTKNFHDSCSHLMKLCSYFSIGLHNGDRYPSVTSIADFWIERYTPKEWNTETLTFLLPSPATKDLSLLSTIRTRKKTHIFNNAEQRGTDLFKHLR